MTALEPASWWRGLGGRGVSEGVTRPAMGRLAEEATLEPAIVPHGELPR